MWVWKKSQWWEREKKPSEMGIGRSEISQNNIIMAVLITVIDKYLL